MLRINTLLDLKPWSSVHPLMDAQNQGFASQHRATKAHLFLPTHPPPSRYLGSKGKHVGIDSFGASAPANILYEKFGITTENVIKSAKEVMGH
jgi:transketolase